MSTETPKPETTPKADPAPAAKVTDPYKKPVPQTADPDPAPASGGGG